MFPTLTREEYAALLAAGAKFRDASLYEPDHAPKDQFFFVALTKDYRVLKRRIA